MNEEQLAHFMRERPWAVQASISAARGGPQAAVIGIVVSDELELFFDTYKTSRKYANLIKDPRIALVVGWDDGQTVQYEGDAFEPQGAELARWKQRYFERFPEGAERHASPTIAYFGVRPRWLRYSDFRASPPVIVEFKETRSGRLPLV